MSDSVRGPAERLRKSMGQRAIANGFSRSGYLYWKAFDDTLGGIYLDVNRHGQFQAVLAIRVRRIGKSAAKLRYADAHLFEFLGTQLEAEEAAVLAESEPELDRVMREWRLHLDRRIEQTATDSGLKSLVMDENGRRTEILTTKELRQALGIGRPRGRWVYGSADSTAFPGRSDPDSQE